MQSGTGLHAGFIRKFYKHLHHIGSDALQVERIIHNWLASLVNLCCQPYSNKLLLPYPLTSFYLAQEEAAQGYGLGPEVLHLLQPLRVQLRGHYAIP